jgi:molybdate transport system substrate-binding protein
MPPAPIRATCVAATLMMILGTTAATLASAEPVEIFAAGSLRGVVAELAKEVAGNYNIEVQPSFGGSGSMRERIEKGEKPDLLMSADLGSPRKLEAQGRTVVPAVAFARNRMCIVSRRSAGVTAANLIDRMLKRDVRLKTSTPIADPSGDYAWAILDRIDAIRPGAGATLKKKAQASMDKTATPATPNGSAAAALFASKQIDMSITYCSASSGLEKELPELTSLEVPARLDPHPVYAIAVLSTKPEAMRVALFLLSEKGQSLIASQGLVALNPPADASR